MGNTVAGTSNLSLCDLPVTTIILFSMLSLLARNLFPVFDVIEMTSLQLSGDLKLGNFTTKSLCFEDWLCQGAPSHLRSVRAVVWIWLICAQKGSVLEPWFPVQCCEGEVETLRCRYWMIGGVALEKSPALVFCSSNGKQTKVARGSTVACD